MPDSDETQAGASAENAYAKASENIATVKPEQAAAVKPAPEVVVTATTVEIPSVKPMVEKAKAEPKPVAVAKPAPAESAPVKPAKTVSAKVKAAPKGKAAPKKAPVKAASLTSISPKITPPKSTASTPSADAANKDKTMTKKVTTGFESIISDAQTKAKDAFEKSTALFGDYADFTKGNIEAVVQSGKIFAEGLQNMGSTFVEESRSAFETASTDIKGMAAAKSPTDLIQLQSDMLRKSFDNAVAYGSKNTEAMIKLVSEAMGPLSGRVSLAVEKVRTATI